MLIQYTKMGFLTRIRHAIKEFYNPSVVVVEGNRHLHFTGNLTLSSDNNIQILSGKHLGNEEGYILLNSDAVTEITADEVLDENEVVHDGVECIDCEIEPTVESCGCDECICGEKDDG